MERKRAPRTGSRGPAPLVPEERQNVVAVRLHRQLLSRVEEWGARQEPPVGKSAAIRLLLERSLVD